MMNKAIIPCAFCRVTTYSLSVVVDDVVVVAAAANAVVVNVIVVIWLNDVLLLTARTVTAYLDGRHAPLRPPAVATAASPARC